MNIVDYKPEYARYFIEFNKQWLEELFVVEDIDKWVLENPEEAILQDGGKIFFAEYNNKIIGTAALKSEGGGIYELTKMAVDKAWRGLGAGELLCKHAISLAKSMNGNILYLYSNTRLQAAISIYRKLGFRETPIGNGIYRRADIKMQLNLKTLDH